ncbi:hypothetical protein V7094_27740 [Priestia megaterium]|uniref:hypothetical protein n=1 Tax=Priestia megaterium TaxID=1404 RepID=UPI003000356D
MNASLKDIENQLRNFWTQPQPEVSIEEDSKAYEAFKTQLGGNHTMTTLTEKQQAFMELVAVHQLAGAVQEQAEEGMREILLSVAKEALEGTSQPEQKLYPINAFGTEDEGVFETIISLIEIGEDFGFDHELYKSMNKAVCNMVREQLDTDNVVSFGLNTETEEVLVYEYDLEADQETIYETRMDDEKGIPYLIVK